MQLIYNYYLIYLIKYLTLNKQIYGYLPITLNIAINKINDVKIF